MVKGGDLLSKGCEFESQRWILDRHLRIVDIVKIVLFNNTKKRRRGRVGLLKINKYVSSSVTRWLDFSSNNWPIKAMKFCPMAKNAKVSPNFAIRRAQCDFSAEFFRLIHIS